MCKHKYFNVKLKYGYAECFAFWHTDEGSSHSVENPNGKFELRNYQKELAEHALTGGNCIIVAPTGSGKTHVAIYIIKVGELITFFRMHKLL